VARLLDGAKPTLLATDPPYHPITHGFASTTRPAGMERDREHERGAVRPYGHSPP